MLDKWLPLIFEAGRSPNLITQIIIIVIYLNGTNYKQITALILPNVYICICIYIYTCIYTYVYIYIYI